MTDPILQIKTVWDNAIGTVRLGLAAMSDDQLHRMHGALSAVLDEFAQKQQEIEAEGEMTCVPSEDTMAMMITVQMIELEQRIRHVKTCAKCKADSISHMH